jgi:Pyridoxamine 5'-phosphate oxidase like
MPRRAAPKMGTSHFARRVKWALMLTQELTHRLAKSCKSLIHWLRTVVVQLFRDPDKMRQLWTAWIEPWFPDGLKDPDLALLEITVSEAEYWDAPASRTRRLFGLAKAMTTRNTDELGEHATVHPAEATHPGNGGTLAGCWGQRRR